MALSSIVGSIGATAQVRTSPTAEQINTEVRTQRIFETQNFLSNLKRFESVAYAVLQAASPYCLQNRKYSIGVPPVVASALPEDLRRGFTEWRGPNKAPLFQHVPRSSPAAAAGIRKGDELVSITDNANGKALDPAWVFRRPINTLVQNATFKLVWTRGDATQTAEVRPQLICDELPRLLRRDEAIAEVSFGNMTVSTGLLRQLASDDELALVLSNEIAHAILAHASGANPSRRPRISSAGRYTAEEEFAADYLGAYIAIFAGFNVNKAQDTWRRIASNAPSNTAAALRRRQPLSAERAIWQQAIRMEIRKKELSGVPQFPDSKSLPSGLGPELVAIIESTAPTSDQIVGNVDPRLTRVAEVPFVNSDGRSGYQRFLGSPLHPRAFAVGPTGAWAYASGANAANEALKNCSVRGTLCYLYAVDDKVVWNPETAELTPQPPEAEVVDRRLARITEVPLINSEGRVGYERFLNVTVRPRAFAIGPKPDGGASWAYKSGPNASSDALAHCTLLTHGLPCYLYAVDDRVVWALENAPVLADTPRENLESMTALRRPANSGFAEIDDLAAVPLRQDQLATYRAFLEKPAPRAFVMTREGYGRYWLGTGAMEDALSYCERLGEPCWLYAVDNDVVWQADKNKRISRRAQLSKQPDEIQFLK